MLNSFLISLLLGTFWGLAHNSEPWKELMKWSRLGVFSLFQCVSCSGYWFSLLCLALLQPTHLIWLWAAVSAVWANEIQRRLWI